MICVRRHYTAIAREIELHTPLNLTHLTRPIVIVPMSGWSKIAEKALRVAMILSNEIHVLQVKNSDKTEDFQRRWCQLVEDPALELGVLPPKLTVVQSPYRMLFGPILSFIEKIEMENPDRHIAVLVPELVERRWGHYFLHNQRAAVLKALLLVRGNQRINVINVPWYITA